MENGENTLTTNNVSSLGLSDCASLGLAAPAWLCLLTASRLPPHKRYLLSHPTTLLLLSRARWLSQAAARPCCLHHPHLSLEPLQAAGTWRRLMLPRLSPVP